MLTLLPSLLTPKDIEVPDVSGMSLDRAVTELINAGFVLGETMEISHEDIEEGDVVRTDPKEGRMAKEGSEINIYKSTGKPTFKLLDYTSRNLDDVLAVLKNKDFKDIDIVEVPNDSSEGMILDQNYREGEDVIPEETILEFTVSSGPELINVKDLSEYSLIGVQDYANDNGLDVAVSEEQYHETIPEGDVISQEPKAGAKVDKGSKITVVISKGPEALPPKTVPVEVTIPYNPEVEGTPQIARIQVGDMERDITETTYTYTITQNETRQIELMIAPGTKASYQVTVDDKVVLSETVSYPE